MSMCGRRGNPETTLRSIYKHGATQPTAPELYLLVPLHLPLHLCPHSKKQNRAEHHGDAAAGCARLGRRGPGAPGGGRVGGLVAVRGVHHGRQRARGLQRAGAAGGVAHPHPAVRRRRLRLPAQVPLRRIQHPDEARPRQLRRHRHLLLPVVGRGARARRDRHGVHGQRDGAAGGAQHQRVGQRRRQEGAPVRPLVRPGRRLPHLHHHLEPHERHLQGGRPLHPQLQALRRPALPGRQAHVRARHALGRQLLGHAEGQGPRRLVRRALCRLLPRLLRPRMRALGRRGRRQPALLPRRHRPMDGPAARRRRARHRRMGQARLHALQLLRRWLAIPAGLPRRVRPRMNSTQLIEFTTARHPKPDCSFAVHSFRVYWSSFLGLGSALCILDFVNSLCIFLPRGIRLTIMKVNSSSKYWNTQ